MAGPHASERSPAAQIRGYAVALLLVAVSTLAGLIAAPRWGNSAVDLLYLPAVLGAAVLAGLGPALLAALVSALAYNFFFTAPHLTFRIANPNNVVTVLVLFAVAAVTSKLAASIRSQARIAEAHAARNATIAGLARRLLSCTSEQEIAEVSTRELARIFECNALLVGSGDELRVLASAPTPMRLTPGGSGRRRIDAYHRRTYRPRARQGHSDRVAVPSGAIGKCGSRRDGDRTR